MKRTATLSAILISTTMLGCTPQATDSSQHPTDIQEIVSNLEEAGFPREDIKIVDGTVYVGNDAEVSLAASKEMLQTGSRKEQYRTNNVISRSIRKICIDGSALTGVFSTALNLAIQNYDEQPLTFAMARTPSTGCDFTINAVIRPNVDGGVSGFPAGGLPFPTIEIGSLVERHGVDTTEHVITHEIGHTIGFRHSDFFNRSISCGIGGRESDPENAGAILISGTPSGATAGGSIMNSCTRPSETGEFTGTDIAALKAMYFAPPASDILFSNSNTGLLSEWLMSNGAIAGVVNLFAEPAEIHVVGIGDFNGDGTSDILFSNSNTGLLSEWLMSNGAVSAVVNLFAEPSEIKVVGIGDFNGDGTSDILFTNTNTGLLSEWLMSNGNVGGVINLFAEPSEIKIAGIGDFNGDHTSDILFTNTNTGLLSEWLMSNGNVGGVINLFAEPSEIKVAGIGDFNRDGTSDILFTNTNTGLLSEWLMSNGNVGGAINLFAEPSEISVAGIGDFDGDGTSDILFRNASTGLMSEWLMSGGSVGSVVNLFALPGEVRVVGIGDFNR